MLPRNGHAHGKACGPGRFRLLSAAFLAACLLVALCSRLMLFGFLEETHTIDVQIVEDVVEELDEAELGAMPQTGTPARVGGEEPEAISDQIEELAARIGLLERYVAAHERAINMALEIARQQFPEAVQQVQPQSAARSDN